MSIKVDMTSTDVDRQLALLNYYPEILQKYFRPALGTSVKSLAEMIRPNIPRATGQALAAFKSRVTGGKGINLQGQVGWYGNNPAWYIRLVEGGVKPHKIEARKGGFLWFGGHVVRSVDHPGFSARGFMAAGYAAMQPMIEALMGQASEQVVNELAVK